MKRAVWVGASVLVLVAAGLSVAALAPWSVESKVPTAKVEKQQFVRRITAEGNLEAVKATVLSPPMQVQGGAKVAWLADDGSQVKAGDVVIRFDPTELERNLEDGNETRATAEERLTSKRVQQDGVLKNLDRDAEVAGLEVDFARKFQSKDAEIFSRREIVTSAIDEELATHRQVHAHDVRGIRDTQGKAEMSLIAVDRKKADIKIGQAQTGLKALEVTAPHDGLFVLKREWGDIVRVGETVWPGQPVAEIPDLTKMKAKIYVLEADAGGLEPGRQASVIMDSRPGVRWPAKVSKVAAFAKPRNRWLPVQYFEVELELEKTDPAWMKPGQRVRADLSLEDRKDALVVPREAVQEKDGKHLVWKKDAKGFSPVEVTLGPAALGRVVIEKGLAEKDVVALRDPTAPEPLPGSKKAEPQNGGGGGGGGGGMVIIR